MRAQQGLVAGTTGHHDLDGALLGVGVVPVGAQAHDLVVQVRADVAAHGHHHGLAALCRVALFKMRHQVLRHAGHAGFGADHLLQRGPAAFQARLHAFFFVLGQLVHLGVDAGQLVGLQAQLDHAAFVVNGHGGAVFLGLLHVIHVDVVAKHRARVAVGAAHWCAGKRDKGGVGQGIAQMLGVTHLVALHRVGVCTGAVGGRRKLSAMCGCHAAARGDHRICYCIDSW
ncbi:hypothetical protein D3C71_1114280 [compost metagenome]